MRTKLIAVVSAVVAAVAAVAVFASLAVAGVPPGYKPGNPPKPPAATPPVKQPYPNACSLQQTKLDQARNTYNTYSKVFARDKILWQSKKMSTEDFEKAQRSLDGLARALIQAEYALALCYNSKAKPPDKCLGLELQKNEVAALLQQDQDVLNLDSLLLAEGEALLKRGAISKEQFETQYQLPYDNAVAQVNGDQNQIKELEQEMTEAGCNAKPSTTPSVTPSSKPSTTPSGTPSPKPSTSASPKPTGSSPVPATP
jgi:hypothetical protein